MKLTVLGGSAAGPNPGQGCSGYLVHSGPTRIVLDLGPGTFPELRKHINFRDIAGIVVTHLHLDHWLDILTMRFALAYNPVAPRGEIALWLPPGGLSLLERLAIAITGRAGEHGYFSVFAAQEFDPAAELTIGEVTIRFRPTIHSVPCWAIRVSNGRDGDLFYTADTGPSAGLAPFAAGSFVVIAEGAARAGSGESVETRGHLTPAEAGDLARQLNAGILILSHLWAENDQFAAVEEARRAFGGPVELATPGMTLSWANARD